MEIHEIDAHVDEHLDALSAADTSAMNENQLKLFNLCGYLRAAKPVLKFVRGLLFWKPKWQNVIDKLQDAIDESCPAV